MTRQRFCSMASILIVASGMSIGAAVDAALASPAPERPPPSAACRAWRDHIADLLEQHRHAREIDDVTFANAMHLFYEADSACTLSRFR